MNPLIATEIGKDLGDGVRIGGDGFAVRLESPSSAQAESVEDRAFFANALADSDMVVMPTPKGVQVSLQVRSEDAPEQAVLALDLPRGAELKLVADGAARAEGGLPGSAEVVRGDELLAMIEPPAGWDADREPLEGVRYSVNGDKLVVHYPHRSADVLYPLAVDPAVDRSRVDEYGRVIANGRGWVIGHSNDSELAAWNFNNAGAGSQLKSPSIRCSPTGPECAPLPIGVGDGRSGGRYRRRPSAQRLRGDDDTRRLGRIGQCHDHGHHPRCRPGDRL